MNQLATKLIPILKIPTHFLIFSQFIKFAYSITHIQNSTILFEWCLRPTKSM